jgi:hypothetical protein
MIKVLKRLLSKMLREDCANASQPNARPERRNGTGDFRAVEIEPSIICCAAAIQVTGRSYLLRGAPRLPLYGCTMPMNCSCKFRRHCDRRDSDRRLFGAAETNRWFVGLDRRKHASRRSAGK